MWYDQAMKLYSFVKSASHKTGRRLGTFLGSALLVAATASCGSLGITEMNVTLGTQTATYDTMNKQEFSIPTVPCPLIDCTSVIRMLGIIDNRIVPICEMPSGTCAADLNITIIYIQNVAEDPAFKTGIAQSSADAVRDVTLNYSVESKLNLDIQKVDVYIGPNGIMSKNDPGVVPIGSIGPIKAMSTLESGMMPLIIPDGSPAHAQIVKNIMNPAEPFNFLFYATTRIGAGNKLPTGALTVKTTPSIRFLKR